MTEGSYFNFTDRLSSDYYEFLITRAYHYKSACMQSFGLTQYVEGSNTHDKVLELLYLTPFKVINPKDGNRVSDALSAREDWMVTHFFGRSSSASVRNKVHAEKMYGWAPNCLEILLYLAERLESTFTGESGLAQMELTAQWFWLMLRNIGLAQIGDDVYTPTVAKEILDRWIFLEYQPDGTGGCFILNDHGDMRQIEIWYQAQWYYASILKKKTNRGNY